MEAKPKRHYNVTSREERHARHSRELLASKGLLDSPPIKIDKGISMPKFNGDKGRFPFEKMEIGDSFLFPKETEKYSVHSMTYTAGRKLNKKFSIRNTAEGFRCWRVE